MPMLVRRKRVRGCKLRIICVDHVKVSWLIHAIDYLANYFREMIHFNSPTYYMCKKPRIVMHP